VHPETHGYLLQTAGVLTKPDRAPSGDEETWLRFIRNETEPLFNRWYAVKQPDSMALKRGITREAARQEEDTFFSMGTAWSAIGPEYQRYLRTSNLTGQLSTVLSECVAKRFVVSVDSQRSLR
jgi:hypothetical protein